MRRSYYTWDEWECYPAGFYENKPERDITDQQCKTIYRDLLKDIPRFKDALRRVLTEWPNSCDHYLTNERMNRIAWLGQASLCIAEGVPSTYRNGYMMLTVEERYRADLAALWALNLWLVRAGRPVVDLAGAGVNPKRIPDMKEMTAQDA